jgi:hypothetical protein
MLPSAAKKEVFEGNPVEPGNCPATVKGTKADMPLVVTTGKAGK